MRKTLIIGSRQSDLARIQAQSVGQHIQKNSPQINVEYYHRPSFGDLNLDMDLSATDSKGVFTQEFQSLLADKTCDVVVHSWKDLPIEDNPRTKILTLSLREDQRDLLFIKKASFGLSSLKFLTSSPRREYHIKEYLKPLLPFHCEEFKFEAIRGNIPTRFLKFLKSDADGFVVAKAAVDRLMGPETENKVEFQNIRSQILDVFKNCDWMVLPLSEFPTAAAQGALAIEVNKDHPLLPELLKLNDSKNLQLVEKERDTHKKFGGGCHLAVGFSALKTPFGDVFYSSGQHEGHNFHDVQFSPLKKLKTRFTLDKLFSQSSLSSIRNKTIFKFSDLTLENGFISGAEFVITRFEARLEDLKSRNNTVWVSGTQTWKKLAGEGYWINGSLDGLGVQNKPNLDFLQPKDFIWLSNSSSPEEGTGPFRLISTYDLNYDFSHDLNLGELKARIKDKECFLWMSGHCFQSALLAFPEIKNKIHFCGLGRTYETLRKHLNQEQIYICLNEDDFIKQCTSK